MWPYCRSLRTGCREMGQCGGRAAWLPRDQSRPRDLRHLQHLLRIRRHTFNSKSPVRKSHARALLAPCTRCNACMATGPNVHVRFPGGQSRRTQDTVSGIAAHGIRYCCAISPVTPGVQLDRSPKITAVEIGPQPIEEDQLRVGALPEQEVGCPLLPGRADKEVNVRDVGLVE